MGGTPAVVSYSRHTRVATVLGNFVVALLHVEPQLKNSNLFIYTFQKITYKDIIAVYKSEGSAEDAPAAVGFKHV